MLYHLHINPIRHHDDIASERIEYKGNAGVSQVNKAKRLIHEWIMTNYPITDADSFIIDDMDTPYNGIQFIVVYRSTNVPFVFAQVECIG